MSSPLLRYMISRFFQSAKCYSFIELSGSKYVSISFDSSCSSSTIVHVGFCFFIQLMSLGLKFSVLGGRLDTLSPQGGCLENDPELEWRSVCPPRGRLEINGSSGLSFMMRGSGLSIEYEILEGSFTLLFLHKLTILEIS